MIGGMKIEKGAAALAQLPARDQSLVRALGMVHDAWMATLSALSDGGAGDPELDMTIMSAATDLWRAMKRTHSAIEALEMERMLSNEGPETEDISAARGDDGPRIVVGEISDDGGETWRPMNLDELKAAEAEAREEYAQREAERQRRANFNSLADGGGIPYPSEY